MTNLAAPFYQLHWHEIILVSYKLIEHLNKQARARGVIVSDHLNNNRNNVLRIMRHYSKCRRTCMSNFPFIVIDEQGEFRITQTLVNHMLKLNDAILYAEGTQIDIINDIDHVCSVSEETMNTKYAILDEIINQRIDAIRDTDYNGIINMANSASFREIGQVDANLTRIFDFTHNLSMIAELNTQYNRALFDAEHSTLAHRLNLRTRVFKPWKLYSCKPVYPDCMAPMSFYDTTDITDFDTNFIIPEDIGRIITEFVGYKFISSIREGLILSAKGDSVSLRNDIKTALNTWRKGELLDFTRAVPYNIMTLSTPQISNQTFPVVLPSSYLKSMIIDYIMNNFKNNELYYPFYRDVILLTPIIKNHRVAVRERKRVESIARWRKAHAEKVTR